MKNILLLLLVFLTGCGTSQQVAEAVHLSKSGSQELLGQLKTLGDKIQVYTIPIMIEKPVDATLNINFKIKSAGYCPTSYEPTVFYLNNRLIAEFDFRHYFLKTEIKKTVTINRQLFLNGMNSLKIETGQCQYDIDVLDLNRLRLNFKGSL